ncbi:hypothetical protein B0H15DRAFT_933843 [Mycena belliarum]|uniref:Fungal calcium binding protein domain-containing protein n=1 Tax=Mycena belliarum TaxID=1033014 RepID=A0AAD6XJ06_9AGAR|nr:hypothetical protein B0H15DRAFT_933843 [Mycena belliae]
MQFTFVALLAVLASGVAAAPTPVYFARDGTCDVKTCVLDLAPSVIACASAAAQLGADVLSDAGCIVAAAKAGTSFPTSCAGCADQLGVADDVAAAQSAVSGAAQNAGDKIKDGLGSIGHKIGGIF